MVNASHVGHHDLMRSSVAVGIVATIDASTIVLRPLITARKL